MTLLPEAKTDKFALIQEGYNVTYEDAEGEELLTDMQISDAMKETISKNGVPQAPDNQASIKYYDKNSKALIAAIWTNPKGKPHRENAPAVVYERSEKTGNAVGYYHRDQAYCINGELHNHNGAAITLETALDGGKLIKTLEEFYQKGIRLRSIRRDCTTGVVEYDSATDESLSNQPA